MCPDCLARLADEVLPKERKRLRVELTVSFFFAAAIFAVFGVVIPMFVSNALTLGALVGAGFTVTQFGLAAVFLFSPRAAPGFVSVALQLAGALALMAMAGPSCITLALLTFPVMTFVRVAKWRTLSR